MVMSLILMLAVGWRIKQDKAKQTPSTDLLRGKWAKTTDSELLRRLSSGLF